MEYRWINIDWYYAYVQNVHILVILLFWCNDAFHSLCTICALRVGRLCIFSFCTHVAFHTRTIGISRMYLMLLPSNLNSYLWWTQQPFILYRVTLLVACNAQPVMRKHWKEYHKPHISMFIEISWCIGTKKEINGVMCNSKRNYQD